jgi:hypothetical protein
MLEEIALRGESEEWRTGPRNRCPGSSDSRAPIRPELALVFESLTLAEEANVRQRRRG